MLITINKHFNAEVGQLLEKMVSCSEFYFNKLS